jgi:hypothetical protein
MSLTKEALQNYLTSLNNFVADLPDGGNINEAVVTAPHSADQRSTSVDKINGVKITKAQNEEGRVTLIICTDNGQSIHMDDTGNIFFGCGKIGEDETGGQITMRPQGDMTVKVGGRFAMEVENMLDEEKPLSVVSYGDINVESKGGDVFLKGDNVTVRALKDLNLSGSTVNIQGGDGAGGVVSLVANTFKTDTTFINQTVSGGITQNVLGEATIRQILDPRACHTISSAGHLKLTAAGDFSIDVGGKMEVNVAGTPPKPIPTVKNPSSFSLSVAQGNVTHTIAAGNLTEKYTGNVTTAIEGNVTEQITGNLTESATGNYSNTVEGNFVEAITGNVTETITGNNTISITGNHTGTVTGNTTETFTGPYAGTYSGNLTETVAGLMSTTVTGIVNITGSQINLN